MAGHGSISGVFWLSTLVVLALAPTIVGAQRDEPSDSDDRQPPAADRAERRGTGEDRDERAGRDSTPAPFWLGLECERLPDSLRAQIDVPEGRGLLVNTVVPKSPAAAAGLMAHDVLLAADGKPLAAVRDLVHALHETKERPLTIELLRKGKTQTVKVTPSRRPETAASEPSETPWNVIERLQRATQPQRIRRLTPSMALSPGGLMKPPFPDDLNVTITKNGNTPAHVEVKQGDQSWTVAEDELDKLPQKVRAPVQGLLGQFPMFGPQGISVQFSEPDDAAAAQAQHAEQADRGSNARNRHEVRPPGFPGAGMPINPQLERQLRRMSRQLQELREDLEELRHERDARRDRDMSRDDEDDD